MKRDAIVLVRSIYRANKTKSKTEYLEVFLDDFEILKLEVRLCADMKILSICIMVIRTTTRTIQTGSVLFGILSKPVPCPDKLFF